MSILKVGNDIVNLNDPAAVVTALEKVRIRLASGQLRETVRLDGEEIVFQRAKMQDLKDLISEYENKAEKSKPGGTRRRYARRISWGG